MGPPLNNPVDMGYSDYPTPVLYLEPEVDA